MLFTKPLYTLLTALSFSSSTCALASADGVVQALGHATVFTRQAVNIAQHVNPGNFFSTVPQLIQQHRQVINALGVASATIEEESTIVINIHIGGPSARRERSQLRAPSDNDQQSVLGAIREFARLVETLSEVEVRQAALIKHTPFGGQMITTLRVTLQSVDAIAYSAIDLTPKYQSETASAKKTMDDALQSVLVAYNN